MAVLRIDAVQRRRRLGSRHGLGTPAAGVPGAAEAVVGLHASDPATVYLSTRARVPGFAVGDLERALYDDRSLVRMLGMRRTMFVVSRDTASVMDAACTRALAPAERRRLARLVEDQGITDDGEAWIIDVLDRTLAALGRRGEATAGELSEDVEELKLKLRFGEGRSWGGTFGMSTRVLFLLAAEGSIVRGRPRGTWLSSQYRWSATEAWLGEPLAPIEERPARTELARRWLASFGPGTVDDLKWWTGWTVAATKRALADAGAEEVDLGGRAGYVAPGDAGLLPEASTWVALLPALDATPMGWRERDWYLGGHDDALFDRNGNIGPTVWVDGRVVGAWAQRDDGSIATRLLEDVGAEAAGAVEAEAARVLAWLGGVRVTPRFRAPLEKELSSG